MVRIFGSRRKEHAARAKLAELDLIVEQGDGTFRVRLPSRRDEIITVDDYTTARILEETERVIALTDYKHARA